MSKTLVVCGIIALLFGLPVVHAQDVHVNWVYLAESELSNDPHKAIELSTTGIEYATLLQDSSALVDLHLIIGKAALLLGEYQEALDQQYKALHLAQLVQNEQQRARAYCALGRTFADQGAIESAQDMIAQALEIAQQAALPLVEAEALNQKGNLYYEVQDFAMALQHFEESLHIREQHGDASLVARSLNNIGVMHKKLGHLQAAVKYTTQAYEVFKRLDERSSSSLVLMNLGELYEISGRNDLANQYYQQGLELALEFGLKKYAADGCEYLAALNRKLGNFEQAIYYQDLLIAYKDSLYKDEIAARITEADRMLKVNQHEAEHQKAVANNNITLLQKENEIKDAKLRTRKFLQAGILIILVLLCAFIWTLYRKNRYEKLVSQRSRDHEKRTAERNEELHGINQKLKISQEELRNINATKDKLFSIISHDLKAPLNSLMGFIDVIKYDFKTFNEEEVKHFASQIEHSVSSIQMLLNNLLHWSANQTGNLRFSPTLVQLDQLIKENTGLASEQAWDKGIEFEIEVMSIQIMADYNMISLVIRNLINNAIKFTPFGGKIYILAYEEDREVCLEIRDTGIGMNKETVARLFNQSTHFSSSGTNSEKGFGIGLLLVQEFVAIHNGRIEVSSEVGEGTSFIVHIPQSTHRAKEVIYS